MSTDKIAYTLSPPSPDAPTVSKSFDKFTKSLITSVTNQQSSSILRQQSLIFCELPVGLNLYPTNRSNCGSSKNSLKSSASTLNAMGTAQSIAAAASSLTVETPSVMIVDLDDSRPITQFNLRPMTDESQDNSAVCFDDVDHGDEYVDDEKSEVQQNDSHPNSQQDIFEPIDVVDADAHPSTEPTEPTHIDDHPSRISENTGTAVRNESTTTLLQRRNDRIDWTRPEHQSRQYFDVRLACHYLANVRHADMTFEIECEQVSVPAHRLIVGTASPFLDRLCNDVDRSVDVCIVVGDNCKLAEFMVLLEYLYTGGSVRHKLNTTNAIAITKVAHGFELNELSAQCVRFLSDKLALDNVCMFYSSLQPLENAFTRQCLQIMVANIDKILLDDSAMSMSDDALGKLFAAAEQSKRNVCASLVLEALAERWATTECAKQGLEATAENRRLVADERLRLVKFEQISVQQFTKSLQRIGPDFFTCDETGQLLRRILQKKRVECVDSPMRSMVMHTMAMPKKHMSSRDRMAAAVASRSHMSCDEKTCLLCSANASKTVTRSINNRANKR